MSNGTSLFVISPPLLICRSYNTVYSVQKPLVPVVILPLFADIVDPCQSFPCAEGSTCIALSPINHSCSCALGFTGSDCSTNIDECTNSYCPANSQCVDGIAGFQCECDEGFQGDNCTSSTVQRGKEICCDVSLFPSYTHTHTHTHTHARTHTYTYTYTHTHTHNTHTHTHTHTHTYTPVDSVIVGAVVGGVGGLLILLLLVIVVICIVATRRAKQKTFTPG